MTVHNTITVSAVETLKTKTEVHIISDTEVHYTRVIDGKILTVINRAEEPITIGNIGTLTKLDDTMFSLCASTLEDAERPIE